MNDTTYYPGTRLMVFNHRVYKNDKDTPLSVTVQPATVLRWYGKINKYGIYPSLVDVKFDSDERESKAHFADEIYIEVINNG